MVFAGIKKHCWYSMAEDSLVFSTSSFCGYCWYVLVWVTCAVGAHLAAPISFDRLKVPYGI